MDYTTLAKAALGVALFFVVWLGGVGVTVFIVHSAWAAGVGAGSLVFMVGACILQVRATAQLLIAEFSHWVKKRDDADPRAKR